MRFNVIAFAILALSCCCSLIAASSISPRGAVVAGSIAARQATSSASSSTSSSAAAASSSSGSASGGGTLNVTESTCSMNNALSAGQSASWTDSTASTCCTNATATTCFFRMQSSVDDKTKCVIPNCATLATGDSGQMAGFKPLSSTTGTGANNNTFVIGSGAVGGMLKWSLAPWREGGGGITQALASCSALTVALGLAAVLTIT